METVQIQFDFGESSPTVLTQVEKSSSKESEKFVFEFMDIINAPIITFSSSWVDAIPERLRKDIRIARILSGFALEEMASIAETVAYIITRTYEAPMNQEWTNIYLWCSAHYLKQYANKTNADFEDIHVPEKLNEYEEFLLKKLRVWIFEKRRTVVKERMKQLRKSINDNAY